MATTANNLRRTKKEVQVREEGRFVRSELTFKADTNSYQCTAGQHLTRQGILSEPRLVLILLFQQ